MINPFKKPMYRCFNCRKRTFAVIGRQEVMLCRKCYEKYGKILMAGVDTLAKNALNTTQKEEV